MDPTPEGKSIQDDLAMATSALRSFLELTRDDVPFLQAQPRAVPAPLVKSDARRQDRPVSPDRSTAQPFKATPAAPAAPRLQPEPPDPFAGEDLDAIAARVVACKACSLADGRTQTVFGEGPVGARVMFVGEGPGAEEDRQGRPFVGAAGQLLDRMIIAMELRREDCYIANVVKCRPPDNATPLPDQSGACMPYLVAQIRRVKPECLVALGATAAMALTGSKDSIARLRGRMLRYGEIPLFVTYHPAALLRNPGYKKPAWQDLQLVMTRLRLK
jgi:DNA polymerase